MVWPALGPRDVRLAAKFRVRGGKFVDGAVIVAKPREPPVGVLATVATWCAPGAACREKNLSPGLVEFLRNLRAGLGAADDQHGPRQKLLRVAITVGMKLLDSGWKCTAQSGILRRLIEARRNDNVARFQPFAAVNLDDIIAAVAVALDRSDARAVANRQVSRKRFEIGHDFVLRHESVRIVLTVANAG